MGATYETGTAHPAGALQIAIVFFCGKVHIAQTIFILLVFVVLLLSFCFGHSIVYLHSTFYECFLRIFYLCSFFTLGDIHKNKKRNVYI